MALLTEAEQNALMEAYRTKTVNTARQQAKRYRGVDVGGMECAALEALVRAARSFDSSRGYRFTTWLYTCVLRALRYEAQLQLRGGDTLSLDYELLPGEEGQPIRLLDTIAAPDEPAEDLLAREEEADRLWGFVGGMRPEDAKTLAARFGFGLSLRDVGQREGISLQAISLREHRALRRVREQWRSELQPVPEPGQGVWQLHGLL